MNSSTFKLFATGPFKALDLLDAADQMYKDEKTICNKTAHVANIFETVQDMANSISIMNEVEELLKEFRLLWDCIQNCKMIIDTARTVSWAGLDPDSFEDSAKGMVQALRRLPKGVKNSDAFKGADKMVKEFLSTTPLIISLRSPAMRERHWKELMDVVKKEFPLPALNPKMMLKDLLDLELHLHALEVEEITEKALKESKHEETLKNLEATWSSVIFAMNLYKDTDVPLLKLEDEAVETLESDQVLSPFFL
jgi:dynein heavy chain